MPVQLTLPPPSWRRERIDAFNDLMVAAEALAHYNALLQTAGINAGAAIQRRNELRDHIATSLLPRFVAS